jgi:hypothetical protein
MKVYSLLLLCVLMMSGCGLYRMPDENEEHTLPTTNNPSVTRDTGPRAPGQSF